jgi:hypothetical protein
MPDTTSNDFSAAYVRGCMLEGTYCQLCPHPFCWGRLHPLPDSTGVIDMGKPDLELIGRDLAPPKLQPPSSWKGVELQFAVSCSCHGLSGITQHPGRSTALTLSWAPSALMMRVWDNRIGPGDSTVLLWVLFFFLSQQVFVA